MMQNNTLSIKKLAGMPHHAADVINGMQTSRYEGADTFMDRDGKYVDCSNPNSNNLYAPIGYYMAAWDMRHGHIALDPTGHIAYVRDWSTDGSLSILSTWHAISSFGAEYGVPKQKRTLAWERQLLVQASELPRIQRGFRLCDKVVSRVDNGSENGKTDMSDYDGKSNWSIEDDPEWFRTWKGRVEATARATDLIAAMTADEHSAANLIRMFACNLLEPYKHFTFVLYGEGGNGKGILLNGIRNQWPSSATNIDLKRLAQNGGFTGEQEAYKLIGRSFVFDEEADVVDERTMGVVKRISTGDTFNARQIGENASIVQATPTLVIATNNPVISDITEASHRRLVLVRMKDGQTADSLRPLREFIRDYGMTPFLYVSWLEWRRSDEAYTDVNIGDSSDMNEVETWMRDSICVNGYADSADRPAGMHVTKQSLNKMGLRRKSKQIDGLVHSVIVVKDEVRFSAYRKGYEAEMREDMPEVKPIPDVQLDISDERQVDPNSYGFGCRFAHCGTDKRAIGWKADTEDGGMPASEALKKDRISYATVPDEGCMIIDLDSPKDDGEPSGWELFNTAVGPYGSDAFPKTYLVKTPHGGAHAYYRIPDEWRGRIKNAAHPKWKGFKAGLPVDIRLERKGYVVGAMSTIPDGSYKLVDLPADCMVPELTEPMLAWMRDHDYVEHAKPATHDARTIRRLASQGEAKPDMSAVPEGQRNTVLHDWALGRYINHPENRTAIHDDLMERARVSGLPDSEAETIWRSILDYVGDR
jgi:hypothetical protein